MELGTRLIGVVLRLLNFLLAPFFWLKRRPIAVNSQPPEELTRSTEELAEAIRNGELTSERLVTLSIERVKEVNPLLNAVVDERYRAALEDARQVDRKIAEARENGTLGDLVKDKPLLGIPFTVKESCSLAGLSNAVGCLEFAGRRATADGGAVRLVREAGAIPLLVSNTPELCLGWETTNLLRGTTNNPYSLDKTPGGSSGGEGALVACGASVFGVGSDIAGSIRVPAAFCGVFGHKPTPGIISIEGHLPTLNDENYARYLTAGPMCRHARDLPLLLRVMAGPNQHLLNLDTPLQARNLKVCYMTECSVSPALLPVHDSIRDAIVSAAKYLGQCGATVTEEKFKDLDDSVEIAVSEFFAMKDIPNMLQDPANPKVDKSLVVELVKCLLGGGSRSLQGLGFTLIHKTNLLIPRHKKIYYADKAYALKRQFEKVLGTDGVFLYPVFSGPAHSHNQVFVRASGVLYTMLFNVLGMPATTVPMGLHDGLPVAIQVVGAPMQDRACLAAARLLEEGFGGWRTPGDSRPVGRST